MTPGGAGDLDRRIGCNTAVERGIQNHTPFAVALGDFYHTDAESRFTHSDVVGTYGAGQGPVYVKDSKIYELVPDWRPYLGSRDRMPRRRTTVGRPNWRRRAS